jgi:hypothetical protein
VSTKILEQTGTFSIKAEFAPKTQKLKQLRRISIEKIEVLAN